MIAAGISVCDHRGRERPRNEAGRNLLDDFSALKWAALGTTNRAKSIGPRAHWSISNRCKSATGIESFICLARRSAFPLTRNSDGNPQAITNSETQNGPDPSKHHNG